MHFCTPLKISETVVSPESNRKPVVFYCFQGVKEETSGKKWVDISIRLIRSLIISNGSIETSSEVTRRVKTVFLTLAAPCISESYIKIKLNLSVCFHTSLWCLKRFYEGL